MTENEFILAFFISMFLQPFAHALGQFIAAAFRKKFGGTKT
jgi:hypothetical protein